MSAHPESYGHWDHAQISELLYERDRLRAELAKHQESEFHPDWSMLEATRASLREHMEIIRGLRAELAFATQERNAYQDAVDVACKERDRLRAECLRLSHAEAEAMSVVLSLEGQLERLRAQVADHKAAFNKLNEVLAENLEDRKRLRAEIAKLREAADNNDAAFIDRMTVERTRLRALLRVAGAALRQVHEGRRHPQLALSIIARIDAALSKEKS